VRGRRGRDLGSRAHPRLPLERLGARPWASRAAGEFQATDQTDAGADQPARDRLTPQERLIAMLAAAGLTNKEIGQQLFLSHRTVGAHLYQIFPKLGITTRAALRDALASQPPSATARIAANRYLKNRPAGPGNSEGAIRQLLLIIASKAGAHPAPAPYAAAERRPRQQIVRSVGGTGR
jgi:DNA-binding CsgD family transcriptional regulator